MDVRHCQTPVLILPDDVPALTSVPRDVRAGASELQSDITDGELGGVRSLIVAPLASRGKVVGALWLGSSASGRRYDADDLILVEELARRAALAVENARLYEDRRRVADTLQASLLPPTLPLVPGIDLGAAYRAHYLWQVRTTCDGRDVRVSEQSPSSPA